MTKKKIGLLAEMREKMVIGCNLKINSSDFCSKRVP